MVTSILFFVNINVWISNSLPQSPFFMTLKNKAFENLQEKEK